MNADEIEVTLFREISLVPFAIEARVTGRNRASGRDLMLKALKSLDIEGSPWRKRDDRLRHLPEDRGDDPKEARRRARKRSRLAYCPQAVCTVEPPLVWGFPIAKAAGASPLVSVTVSWQLVRTASSNVMTSVCAY